MGAVYRCLQRAGNAKPDIDEWYFWKVVINLVGQRVADDSYGFQSVGLEETYSR